MQEQITSTDNTMAPEESSEAMRVLAPNEVAEAEITTPLTNFPEIPQEEQPRFALLAKDNITMKAFRSAEQLRGLTLKSLDDKESFKQVYAAHQFLKGLASTIKKACKAGREPHVAEQKKWIALEESLTGWVEEIEGPIEEQRKLFEKEQARLKEEERKRIEARTNERAREMQSHGVPFDLKACQEFEDEQWTEFMAPHREAKAKGERTKARLSLVRPYFPEVTEEDVADATQEEFDAYLEQNKEAYEVEQERLAERKRVGQERVKSMATINVRVSFDEVVDLSADQFEAMLRKEVDRIASEKKEREERERREKEEREAVEKYTKRFNFIAGKGVTLEEVGTTLDQLKAMADDEWIAFAPKVNEAVTAKQQKIRDQKRKEEGEQRVHSMRLMDVTVTFDEVADLTPEEFQAMWKKAEAKVMAEKEKDRKFRDRYAVLLGIGVKFDAELGAKVREMSDSEYLAFEKEMQNEFDAYMNRPTPEVGEKDLRQSVCELSTRDMPVMIPVPEVDDTDDESALVRGFASVDEPEFMPEGDAVREWVARIRKELEFAPAITSDKASEFASLRTMALDALSDILDLFKDA